VLRRVAERFLNDPEQRERRAMRQVARVVVDQTSRVASLKNCPPASCSA